MLFSINITKDFKSKPNDPDAPKDAKEQMVQQMKEEDKTLKEGIISIISHLIIQWFDKKHNC